MHMQPFRAEIDASVSRLFPWIHWEPIHFLSFSQCWSKTQTCTVGSGGASGLVLPRREMYQFYKWGTHNVSFYPGNFNFPFPNLVGQKAILVSCTFHLEQKIVSCIMYNEIWTYCQWRDIARRDVASFFISGGSACISPRRLNDNRSISQLLGCDVGRDETAFRCVRMHTCVCLLCTCVLIHACAHDHVCVCVCVLSCMLPPGHCGDSGSVQSRRC